MKVCPRCSFSNDERFPTCVLCNTLLVDVPSTPSPNPDHPEHQRTARLRERHAGTRRQIQFAGALYALGITALAAFPGLVLDPLVLLLYFASSIIVALAVARDLAGQFSASILQGIFSVILLVAFGPAQPFIAFMLIGHLVLPGLLWHWTQLIQSANR